MESWQNWALFLVVAAPAAAYYFQSSKATSKRKSQGQPTALEPLKISAARSSQDNRSKSSTGPVGSAISNVEESRSRNSAASKKSTKRKQKADAASKSETVSETPSSVNPDGEESEPVDNDREWVKQLSAARQGVTLSVPDKTGKSQRQKSPRRPKEAPQDSWDEPAAQLERGAAPESEPIQPAHVQAGDVSDMLEPQAPGPSILRVVGEEKPKKAESPQGPAPVQETKKQRQNRKKAEEKKLMREEEEKQRKIAEENQRRTARESRGEPAKNGLGVSSAPTSSAWSQSAKANGSTTIPQPLPVPSKEAPLLDTFEHDTVSTGSSNEPPTNSTTPSTAASTLDHDLPSEEAQMEMLHQMNGDAGWNEVTKAKKGKKKMANASPSPERISKENNHFSSTPTTDLISERAKTPEQASKRGPSTNGFAALDVSNRFTTGSKGHPNDSDWAVD